MNTKWGSSNHQARNIRLNADLAKKPPDCLEYLMDQFMPKWQSHSQALNRLPVRHESWGIDHPRSLRIVGRNVVLEHVAHVVSDVLVLGLRTQSRSAFMK